MNKKILYTIIGLITMLFLICSCSTTQEKSPDSTSATEVLAPNDTNQSSIAGTYTGEGTPSNRWILNIYDDGTLLMNDKRGTYEKIDDEYIFTIDGYAYKLKAEITEKENLYITSDNSNWDAEMYTKHIPPEAPKIELSNALGNNWEDFCEQTDFGKYENFEVKETYDDGSYDLIGDLGTELEVLGDGNLIYIGLGRFETNYSIYGTYVGQNWNAAAKNLKQNNLDCLEDSIHLSGENEKYNSYSLWRKNKNKEEYIDLYIFENGGEVAVITVIE